MIIMGSAGSWLALGLATSTLLSAPRASEDRPSDAVVQRAISVLLRAAGNPLQERAVTEKELRELGSAAAPTLLDVVARRKVDVDVGEGRILAVELAPEVCEVALHVLVSVPRAELLPLLETLAAAQQTTERRMAGMNVLARMGDERDLDLLQQLSAPADADNVIAPEQLQAYEDALAAILERSPASRQRLVKTFVDARPELVVCIVYAVERGQPSSALESLARLLGQRTQEDSFLLGEIARVAQRIHPPTSLIARASVRAYLEAPDPLLVRAAVQASAELEDDEALPALIGLLEEEDASMTSAARDALARIAHKDLGAQPEEWALWYRSELAWWKIESENRADALAQGDASKAAAAILDIGRRRLYRHDAARMLVRGLERSEPHLVHMTCQVLGQLSSPTVVPELNLALTHGDVEVRNAARMALWRIEEQDRARTSRARSRPQQD